MTLKKITASFLSFSIIALAPGLLPYQALAGVTAEGPSGPAGAGAAMRPRMPISFQPTSLNVSDALIKEAGSRIQLAALDNPAAVAELFAKAADPTLEGLTNGPGLVRSSLLNPDGTVPAGVLGAIKEMRSDERFKTFVGKIDGIAGLSGENIRTLSMADVGPEKAAALGDKLLTDLQQGIAKDKAAAAPQECSSGGCPFGFDKLFGKKPQAKPNEGGIEPTAQERVVAKLWKLSRVRPDAFQFLVSVARGQAKATDNEQLAAPLRATGWLDSSGVKPAVAELVTNYSFVEGKSGAARVAISPFKTPGLFRPSDKATGISAAKYAWFNGFYLVMQWLNKTGAKILSLWDKSRKYNKNSWDKWPTQLGMIYLLAKLRFMRSNALWNPYLYATLDNETLGPAPESAKISYTADGKWAAAGPDGQDPQMGVPSKMGVTRWGDNVPQTRARQDPEAIDPAIQRVATLLYRVKDAAGKFITIPGNLMNALALWIQFQMHGFGGNTAHDSIYDKPYELIASDGSKFLVEREAKDHTRVTDEGGRTPVNERSLPWIQAQTYGTNDEELDALRSFENGHMRLDAVGYLPEDPKKPGIDQTGFNNNYNVPLSFQHWEAVQEHNRIADYYRYFHPDWNDEKLFYYARKVNVALMNAEHTRFWTKDLLQLDTLQYGMDADWAGFIGHKRKDYLMRLISRHPWVGKLLKPITNNDSLWGMPGSRLEFHDAPFQTQIQFRMVYRVLHSLLPEDIALLEPGTERKLAQVDLAALISGKTRDAVKAFGYNVITYSMAKAVAGKLDLHNFPSALTKFETQQHELNAPGLRNKSFDLAIVDILRERESWDATYNEFRKSVGEPPVTSFMELTGGREDLAKELERVYGNVDAVDAYIGVLVEPRPEGYVLTYTQFYQFVGNAPRRVKGLWQMTEERWSYANYLEGMNWLNHSMLSPIDRWARNADYAPASGLTGKTYAKELKAEMEGVDRGYAPWKSAEKFPQRLLERHEDDGESILRSNVKGLVIGAVAIAAGVFVGGLTVAMASTLAAYVAVPLVFGYQRLKAWRDFQKTWQASATDARSDVFSLAYSGEKRADRTAFWSKFFAFGVMDGAGMLAYGLMHSHPVVAALMAVLALSGLATLGAVKKYKAGTQLMKVSLLSRLREGQVTTDAKDVPGDTALQKRYWFLIPRGSKTPIATFGGTYRTLKEHGLPSVKAFGTAAVSHLFFGPKTHKSLSWRDWFRLGLWYRPFAIYIPNLAAAESRSSTRIFAEPGNSKGLKPGDFDAVEFEDMFMRYAPGRDYMTADDLARMREGNQWRDATQGRGNFLSRFLGRLEAKRRHGQLMKLYADRVVVDSNGIKPVFVPAISKDMLRRVYEGSAQIDIQNEHTRPGLDEELRMPTRQQAAGANRK